MDDAAVSNGLIRQYRASLAMLQELIERCPEPVWMAQDCRNRFWHIAYHSLFYTHLYLQPSEAEFKALEMHQPAARLLGGRSGALDERIALKPYSQAQLLEYLAFCSSEIEARVPQDVLGANSGFDWLPMNRFELHLYNIRHVQHHAGQLIDRVRNAADIAVTWVRVG